MNEESSQQQPNENETENEKSPQSEQNAGEAANRLSPSQLKLYWISRDRHDDSNENASMLPDSEEWTGKELHLFIVTDAGKPVYSRYGAVHKLSPILCTCVAILGHMESLNEELNHFRAGSHTFVFLPKKPFVFIAVSKSSLPVSYLFKQLNFLYSLFLSLFSENLIHQLSMRPSCDFRQIAEGTRPAWDPAFIFAPAIPVRYCSKELRHVLEEHFQHLQSCKLSMLMYKNRVMTIGSCTCDPLSLRLIVDLLWTPAFQTGESWTPFFMRDSTDVMHHLYINKDKNSDFSIVLLCADSDGLVAYHTAAVKFYNDLFNPKYKENELNNRLLDEAPEIFYCWALNSLQTGQVFITDPKEEIFGFDKKVAMKNIQDISRQLAKACDMVETNTVDGEYMFRGEKEVIVVWKTKDIELYAIAKSEELPDEKISEKLDELRKFINAHFDDIIISNVKFHIAGLFK